MPSPTLPSLLLASLFAVFSHTAAAAAPAPATAAEWRRAALTDIDAAYQLTLENHPGVYDSNNPDFKGNLASARRDALALAGRVTDAHGYSAALQRFDAGFHDGHAGVQAQLDAHLRQRPRWPGFVTAWRRDALYVVGSAAGGPAAGARVNSCDGKPVNDLIASNVFAFQGKIEEPGAWWTLARELFVDFHNPFIKLPRVCQFTVDGATFSAALHWQASTDQSDNWRWDTYNGDDLPVGLSQPASALYWMAMPTFMPDEAQRDAYRAASAELLAHRQRYLDARAIVIDLRQNQGGSSDWSLSFARALWGQQRVDRRMDAWSKNETVWWRASDGNIAHMRMLRAKLLQQRQLESAADKVGRLNGMVAARARGDKFYVAGDALPAAAQADAVDDDSGAPAALQKPVYVIVPGQCASACLDALDVFTRFPNTRLIGAPSSSDSDYMEVRHEVLPSGLAQVTIPVKMYVGRARANGQFYTPSVYVTTLGWSTADFVAAIEKDLMIL
jgi:hypothetical protein